MPRNILPLLLIFICGHAAFGQSKSLPKLTADEIVSKHLTSIGTPEAIAAVKSRVMVGVGTLNSKTTHAGKIGGPAQFASEGQMLLLAMVLNSNDYPFEKVGYDGKDLTAAILPGGTSTALSSFLKSSKFVVKHGLFGGVLCGGWPLLKPEKDVKLEAGGTVKDGDRTLYKLKFSTSGIGDMIVSLYFDSETFRHVKTEYFYRSGQVSSPNPGRAVNGDTAPTEYTVTENFSNFVKVDDLTLPMSYLIEYASPARSLVWTLNFSQAYNNQALEPAVFKVS